MKIDKIEKGKTYFIRGVHLAPRAELIGEIIQKTDKDVTVKVAKKFSLVIPAKLVLRSWNPAVPQFNNRVRIKKGN